MAGRLICKTAANARIRGVHLRSWASWLLAWQTLGAGNVGLRALDKRQGGLWVGGELSVYDSGVRFEPNSFNRAVQEGEFAFEHAWAEVLAIKVRFGILTRIIELTHAHGVQAFRCFGAKRVAAQMTEAWKAGGGLAQS
ncbi:MAG: hypothetical protein AB1429_04445 [Pseudomonadota bacterium]|jgi:hypothetical protein